MRASAASHSLYVFSHHGEIQAGQILHEDALILLYNTPLNDMSSLSVLAERKYHFKRKLSLSPVKLNGQEKKESVALSILGRKQGSGELTRAAPR